jgi:predicted nucleotidyltransferase
MASRVQRCSRATPPRCGVCSLVSIILFGSAASGAFSDSSDVDLIIVLPDEATPEDRRRLREVVSDLEITHSLRLPATRSKNPLEMFAEHAGVTRTLAFSCSRSDLVSGDVARVFGLRAAEELFVDRIVRRLRSTSDSNAFNSSISTPEVRSACGVCRTGWNFDASIHAEVFSTAN